MSAGHGGDGHDKQVKGGAGGWGAPPIKQKHTKGGKKDKGGGKGGNKQKKGGWAWWSPQDSSIAEARQRARASRGADDTGNDWLTDFLVDCTFTVDAESEEERAPNPYK